MAEATLLVSATPTSSFPEVRHLDGDQLQQHRAQPATEGTRNLRSVVSCGHAPQQKVLIVNPQHHPLPGRRRRRSLDPG